MLDYSESRVYGDTGNEAALGQLAAVVIGFETDYVESVAKSGIYDRAREKVIVGKRGDSQYRVEYWIDRLANDRHSDDPRLWNELIKPRYEAWKRGEAAVVDGTPLAALPFVHKRQAEVWRTLNVHTAEDLAKIEDGDLPRLGMDARKARDLSRVFLETRNSGMGQLASEIEAGKQREAAMQARLADMERMLGDLTKPGGKKAA